MVLLRLVNRDGTTQRRSGLRSNPLWRMLGTVFQYPVYPRERQLFPGTKVQVNARESQSVTANGISMIA
jgi:hypothetical protein